MVVNDKKFGFAMLFLRVTVLLVMGVWTLDKFIAPGHATKVFQGFYAMPDLGNTLIYALGAAEFILLVLFFFGIKKTITYGIVLALHAASTLSAFAKYLAPYEGGNLLFFAAWPMLAACVMLFLFREQDTLLQFKPKAVAVESDAALT